MQNDSPKTGLLSKTRTYVGPGYNRWLVPPAALAIHLCIGMAYGFSVFWLPLSQALGISRSIDCPTTMNFMQQIFSTQCDWKISMLGWMYTLFFVFLGGSAALFGGWLEHAGPRKAGLIAAFCWGSSFFISALGIYLHQIWILWLSSGVIGGIGLGLGYISPVSTLIKWFPDHRGMATGMAIMGFGGGAMIGAPLANLLMKHFATATDAGVILTFLVMGSVYLIFMVGGAFAYRLPSPGWKPAGWKEPAAGTVCMITAKHVHLNMVLKTPQFWLIWVVLCLNVTAGIGIIGMASPMLQEIFAGQLIGSTATFAELTVAQKAQIAAIAAGFTGLLSLFNIAGRFCWASLSDVIGRKATYFIFFTLGILLYATAPWSAASGEIALFVLAFGMILSMYGGGFATIPAYLADMFGTQMVGAIHGRLITAWSVAGILGPVIVNYVREYQLARGVPNAEVYNSIVYIMAGLLFLGFLSNLLIKPVHEKFHMSDADLAAERERANEITPEVAAAIAARGDKASSLWILIFAWLIVGIPLAWGIFISLKSALVLF